MKTQIIERTVVVVQHAGQPLAMTVSEEPDVEESGDASSAVVRNELGESPTQAQYRAWWTPVINASFDDPDQEPARLYWPNNVRISLPWPTRVWLTAYRAGGDAGTIGVATSGTEPGYSEMISALEAQKEAIVAELPEGTTFHPSHSGRNVTISTQRRASEFTTDDEMRRWPASTLNSYVNALRPRLKALMQEQRLEQL